MTWLVADIGGTNARFALSTAEDRRLSHIAHLTAADYPAIEAAIEAYLAKAGNPQIAAACFAVACPAKAERIAFTNSPWEFRRSDLAARFGWQSFATINDFEALALGIAGLPSEGLHPLRSGHIRPGAAKAVLGPGTGLGVSGLLADGHGGWVAIAGEGGHIEFAPRRDNEIEFLRFMIARKGRCSVERVLSGAGLTNIYEFLAGQAGMAGRRPDPAEISASGLSGSDPIAVAALDFFLGALGSLAGDLALLLDAQGGVYLGGGILRHLLPILPKSEFLPRFADKGRLSYNLAEIPIFVILDGAVALQGAAQALSREVRHG